MRRADPDADSLAFDFTDPLGPVHYRPLAAQIARKLEDIDGQLRSVVAGTDLTFPPDEPERARAVAELHAAQGWWVIPTADLGQFMFPDSI